MFARRNNHPLKTYKARPNPWCDYADMQEFIERCRYNDLILQSKIPSDYMQPIVW